VTITFVAEKQTFWIAHEESALEHGILETGENISTGLTHLETYEDPRDWNSRLVLLRKDYERALDAWLRVLRLRDPLAKLADYRWHKETGGMTLPDGMSILTTREAQAQITSTTLALSLGTVEPPVRWKAESGWVSLGRDEIGFVAAAVALHVKTCFAAEEEVQSRLEADPDLDVLAAFDATYAQMMAAEMEAMS
jgi:hypothetical protein